MANRIKTLIPRFLMCQSEQLMKTNVFRAIYLRGISHVDGVPVIKDNLEWIKYRMLKLATLSNTADYIEFTLSGEEEAHIGYTIHGNSSGTMDTVNQSDWCAVLGQNFWRANLSSSSYSYNDTDTGNTGCFWIQPRMKAVTYSTSDWKDAFNETDNTFPDAEAGDNDHNFLDNPYENPNNGDIKPRIVAGPTASTEEQLEDSSWAIKPGKNSYIVMSYAKKQQASGEIEIRETETDGGGEWNQQPPMDFEGSYPNTYYLRIIPDMNEIETAGTDTTQGMKIQMSNLCFGGSWQSDRAVDIDGSAYQVEFDGVTTMNSVSGKTLVSERYDRGESFGKFDRWIGWSGAYSNSSRRGRRRWNFSISFLSDDDLIGGNMFNTSYSSMRHNDDFMTKVVQYSKGSATPFLFQWDSTRNERSGELAICRFENNNFAFEQSGPFLYSVALSLIEQF